MSGNARTAQAVYDAWEKRDFDALVEHFADGVAFNDAPRGLVFEGKEGVRDYYKAFDTACPDSTCGAIAACASDNTVAFEGVWVGTNTGTFGPLPATGRSVALPWSQVFRFDQDGKIAGGTVYYDLLSLMTQLGHIAAPVDA